ncbi:MAG: LamG domain-containing protein, partial [Dehalococcoidales bacterium]|nr:LamG domain-containing protein [Dehalococcoidales bacterium]
ALPICEINIIINKEENTSNIQYELGIRGTKAPGVGTIPVGNLAFFLGGISVLPGGYKGWVDGGGPVPLNTWTHVALTFDGNSTRVYINGVLTRTVTGLSGLIGVTSGPLRIGFRSNVVPSYESFNGSIDEVEIFNRALNQTDIQEIFNASSAGKCCNVTPADITAGINDSFNAMPVDPLNGNGWAVGLGTFDQIVANQPFNNTFTFDRRCGIVNATLTIRVKPFISAQYTNDNIFLQAGGSPNWLWPQQNTQWPNTDTTFVFDLSHLPVLNAIPPNTKTNLLPDMNANGFLKVGIQDDTAVDYMTLNLQYI